MTRVVVSVTVTLVNYDKQQQQLHEGSTGVNRGRVLGEEEASVGLQGAAVRGESHQNNGGGRRETRGDGGEDER